DEQERVAVRKDRLDDVLPEGEGWLRHAASLLGVLPEPQARRTRRAGTLTFPAASQATTRTRLAGPDTGIRTAPARTTCRRSDRPSTTSVSVAGSLTEIVKPAPGRILTRGAMVSIVNGTPKDADATSSSTSTIAS